MWGGWSRCVVMLYVKEKKKEKRRKISRKSFVKWKRIFVFFFFSVVFHFGTFLFFCSRKLH